MKLCRFLLFGMFLTLAQLVSAQSECYTSHRENGIRLYNKGEYSAALDEFNAANACLGKPVNHDLDEWIGKSTIHVRLSVNKMVFDATGEDVKKVEVNTNSRTAIVVKNVPDWCDISQQGKTVTVSCHDNTTVAPRKEQISISSGGKTAFLEVLQNAADAEITFDPDRVVFSSNPETQTVSVTSNVTDWSVATTPSWIVAERKNDILLLACSKNASSDIRESEVMISVAEQEFPLQVRQLPGDTVVSFDRDELVFPQEHSMKGVFVSSNMTGWKVSASEPWIEVRRQQDSVMVSVVENQTVFSRHGWIKVTMGSRSSEMAVHQKPKVSDLAMPVSELGNANGTDKETVLVTSVPSELKVYVDDTVVRTTPFTCEVDYEHHSLLMGFERREYLFNDMQQDVEFLPGLRFAQLTFTSPKNIGLRTGFVSANDFGAYCHFQASRPLLKEFVTDSIKPDGYHFMVGPVYQPIPYLGIYAGIGCGFYGGAKTAGMPRINLDYELGVMGFFKNATISLGMRRSQWSFSQKSMTFVFGVGGYLKQYYDNEMGYCSSDSRRWWSVSYMTRPAQNGRGVMFGDLGNEKIRTYIKAMYLTPADTLQNLSGSFGLIVTPVNGIIDVCAGVGADFCLDNAIRKYPNVEAEVGFIVNVWRIPLTVMFHEADLLNDRRLFVDFGVGFHFGRFKKSTYK